MGCCCSNDSTGKGEKVQLWKQKKTQLVDYKFKDVDASKFRDTSISGIRKYIQMLIATSNYFLFVALDIQISYWLLQADPTVYTNVRVGGILYAVFSAISIAFLCYNIYRGVQIYQSDDISDAFIQTEAYRMRNILSYDIFCFFTQITAKRTRRDKIVLYVSDSLYQMPQIMAVKAPQLAIMMTFHDALKVFANSENGIPTSQTSAAMKFGLLMGELALRMFAILILFPYVKCCMKQDSLAEYANYLVESRVNALVKTGKADIREDAEVEEEKGGCC